MYAIPSLDHTAPANTALQAAFPAQTSPATQGVVTNTLGGLAFDWHTMVISVDTDAQTANFTVDGFDFGTATGGDYSGDIALAHTDPFGSVAGDANLAFTVFDNVVVTQVPEPSSALLIALGAGLVDLRRRR